MSSEWRKPNQIINPWQFGDAFEKKTCLWLKGLPELVPTDIVTPPPRQVLSSEKTMPWWYSNCGSDRAKARSKTFPGIAKAMAEQWAGSFVQYGEWVSTSEYLPNDDKLYLGLINRGKYPSYGLVHVENGKLHTAFGEDRFTAWTPLPKP